LISIAITYLIPVVSAEIAKRKISVTINTIGGSVEEMLLNYWDGKDFKELERPFFRLLILSFLHAQNHKAYSVLHFSTRQARSICTLSQTSTNYLPYCFLIYQRNKDLHNILIRLRKAISSYLITLPATYITPEKTPPTLVLTTLDKGIKIISGEKVDL
jgi:hypothetical protein